MPSSIAGCAVPSPSPPVRSQGGVGSLLRDDPGLGSCDTDACKPTQTCRHQKQFLTMAECLQRHFITPWKQKHQDLTELAGMKLAEGFTLTPELPSCRWANTPVHQQIYR